MKGAPSCGRGTQRVPITLELMARQQVAGTSDEFGPLMLCMFPSGFATHQEYVSDLLAPHDRRAEQQAL